MHLVYNEVNSYYVLSEMYADLQTRRFPVRVAQYSQKGDYR